MERRHPSKGDFDEIVIHASEKIGFAIDDTRNLAAYLLENVNDHSTAAALRALGVQDRGLQSLEPTLDRIVQGVSELEDRTSPEGWPEAMLVTADELREIVTNAFMSSSGA